MKKLISASKMKKITVNLMVLAAFIALLPISAFASYSITLNSFLSNDNLTGAISATVDSTPLTLYCVQNNVTVNVPGQYYAENVGLTTSGQLQAAWLMATYGPSFSANTDASIALQLAIWQAVGISYTSAINDNYQIAEATEANYLVSTIPTVNLAYLQSSYSVIDLYTDPALTEPVQNQLGIIVANNDITPTPIPAAVYLLGSGLMGLLGFRRKDKK
jgi:hypothetical protein